MGIKQVGNNGPVTSGVEIRGKGQKLSKVEETLAKAIARLDGNSTLSKKDLDKLKNMKYEDQVKYVNNLLNGTGYRVANVYDCEMDETSPGISWTNYGVYINFSKGGKTIMSDIDGNTTGQTGHLGITHRPTSH